MNVLNSVIILPVASEKSGKEKSGMAGNETEGSGGMLGIKSRADFVMLSIRFGAETSSEWAIEQATSNDIKTNSASCQFPCLKVACQ